MPSRGQQMVNTYLAATTTRRGMAEQMKQVNSKIKDLEEGLAEAMVKNNVRTVNLGQQHGVIQVTLLTRSKRRKKAEVEMALTELLGDKGNVDRVMNIVFAPVQTSQRKLEHLPPQPSFNNVDINQVTW